MAETILAGYGDPEDQEAIPEAMVTTGLRIVSDDEDIKGPWFSNAFFSHLVRESKSAASGSEEQDKKTTLPVSQRLSRAATKEEALNILQGISEFQIPQVRSRTLMPRRISSDKVTHHPTVRRPANRPRYSSCRA